MLLREHDMVKQVIGSGAFELEAKTGESLLITDIHIHAPVSNYATVSIEKTTVGYFRVGGVLGNHLAFPAVDIRDDQTLLKYMIDSGWLGGYPIEEGETFRITGIAQPGAICHVHYEVYDAGDMTSVMPNGSRSEEFTYIAYGHTGAAITAAGEALLDTPVTPSEFPAFPFGADVPARYQMLCGAIVASEHGVGATGPTNNLGTQYLKLVRDRTTMGDDDKNGYLVYRDASALVADAVGGGQSHIRNHSSVDSRKPFKFSEPIIFSPGEELNAYWNYGFAAGSPSVSTALQEVGFIMTAKRAA